MATKQVNKFYKSEDGNYICRFLEWAGSYEAWTKDGCIHWRKDNRINTRADAAKYRYPMVYAVGGYSCEKLGQKKGSFTLTLLHCDTTKVIEPFKGNTVIESIAVVFRRRLPPQNVPRWLRSSMAVE